MGVPKHLTLYFFLASSLHPGRVHLPVPRPHHSTYTHTENDGLSDDHDGDTEVESEEEWLSVAPALGPAATITSRASHVLAVEVSPILYFYLTLLQLYL